MADAAREWIVEGQRITQVTMKVRASSREEALELAKRGVYHDVDTEPGPDTNQRKWTARPAIDAARAPHAAESGK